ncbi:MAG: NAD(P)/FAD-dependent oxidoreductase [Dongiaceae bacterium]
MEIDVLPRDPRPSGWYAMLPPPAPAKELVGRQVADWVVVGAGFAGLAAARRLGELAPNSRIALIDAQRVGLGASGRNSGFIIDLPHGSDTSSVKGRDENLRTLRLNRFAIAWLHELIEKHQIRCDWARRGKYQIAASERGARLGDGFADMLRSIDEPCQILDRAQLAARLGTQHFVHAVHTPECILMNPAALVRGLGDSLPPNVALFEDTPITSIDYGPPHRLTTPRGEIAAPKLILATNGFTTGWGFLGQHLIRMVTYASLTEPLSDRQLDSMGSDPNWGVTCSVPMGTTLRRTGDNRLMARNSWRYGGDTGVSEGEIARARRRHMASLKRRWPQLGEPRIEHCWAGFICLSKNGAPYWGELAPGVLAAICQNGVGVAKGTYQGRAIAEFTLGQDSELVHDMAMFPKAAKHGLGPFVGPVMTAKFRFDELRAGPDR